MLNSITQGLGTRQSPIPRAGWTGIGHATYTADLLRAISEKRTSGRLHFQTRDRRLEGELNFQNGTALNASWGPLKGLNALLAITHTREVEHTLHDVPSTLAIDLPAQWLEYLGGAPATEEIEQISLADGAAQSAESDPQSVATLASEQAYLAYHGRQLGEAFKLGGDPILAYAGEENFSIGYCLKGNRTHGVIARDGIPTSAALKKLHAHLRA